MSTNEAEMNCSGGVQGALEAQHAGQHVEPWQARAALCELLALSLRYPDGALFDAVRSGEWTSAACELSGVLGTPLSEAFSDAVAAFALAFGEGGCEASQAPIDDERFHKLRTEATRLFVGVPDPVVSPYEGIWRAKDDGVKGLLFVNPHSMDVERFCASCGLGQPEGVNEPLDHIATEFELLQYLASLAAGIAAPAEGGPSPSELPGGSPEAAYAQFLEEHLFVWAPRFAEAVEAQAQHPFYKAVAELLKVFLQAAQRS